MAGTRNTGSQGQKEDEGQSSYDWDKEIGSPGQGDEDQGSGNTGDGMED